MAITTDPGIYMLRNKVSGATYVGAAKKGRTRVLGQLRGLMRGDNTSELLQEDWAHLGPEAFEVRFLPVSLERLYWLEKVFIKVMNGLEERGGYNKALGRDRTLASRLRDTERKLERKGRYVFLCKDRRHERINPALALTFCQQLHYLADEIQKLEGAINCEPREVEGLLEAFEVFEATSLVTRKRTLH